MIHKALLATVALSLTLPAGLLAQELPPADPPAPPESAPPEPAPPPAPPPSPRAPAPPAPPAAAAPLPAPAPGPAGARIEFSGTPVIQSVPAPRTDDYPVCRGEVVDSCIQPGAARRAG